jgi:predicted dehydrogenase
LKRIGIMGCGVVASYGHAPAIANTHDLELAALYDPNPQALERLRQQFPHVPGFTDPEAFLASGLDAVSITSPAPVHRDNLEACIRHGLPVLCEKPLAMTDADIAAMIGGMEDAGLPFAAAFCYRFSPVALRIKELIRAGAIGEVRAMRLVYIWDLHGKYEWREDGERVESPRRIGRMLEGGPMVDCGVHQIDLARWWTGSEIVHQQAAGAWVDNDYEAPDHVWLHLDHASGCHTAVEMSFSYTHTAKEPINHFSYHVIGTDGLIRYDRDGWHFEVRNSHGTEFLPGASEKDFEGMYREWSHALHTGELRDMPTGRDGLVATRLARTATEECIAQRRALEAQTVRAGK